MSKDVLTLAREAGIDEWWDSGSDWRKTFDLHLKRFAELVRADEREKYKWDVHSCGPTCKRYACVAMREAVEAEREACAKVAEDSDHVVSGRGYYDQLGDADATARNITAAIRARSNT